MRIVFMGTPDFAVASLKALLDHGEQVVGVVTAPDRPAGRGQKIKEPAVKTFAKQFGIPVLQPEKLRSSTFLEELKALKADIQVVVAFRMLPEVVWDMPAYGTINVHASLLPEYRGAAPINHAIINGEKESGVTTFRLQHEIDTGEILLTAKTPILETDTAGTLHDRLMQLGAETLLQTMDGLKKNTITPIRQDDLSEGMDLKSAPKIFKENCQINWDMECRSINNLIRGLSPYPGAFTLLDGKTLKIFSTEIENAMPAEAVGSYLTDKKNYLKFACKDGYLHILDLQLEGKKRIGIQEFLRGYKFID